MCGGLRGPRCVCGEVRGPRCVCGGLRGPRCVCGGLRGLGVGGEVLSMCVREGSGGGGGEVRG